jgi:hypothetical protein
MTQVNEYATQETDVVFDENMFAINLAEIPDENAPIEGTFSAVIAKATAGRSQKGNPKIDLHWKIEDEGPFHNRRVFDTLTFTEKALFRIRDLLLAIGESKNFDGVVTPDLLFGSRADIVVFMDAGNGQIDPQTNEPYPPRPKIKKYLPEGAGRQQGIDSILGDD